MPISGIRLSDKTSRLRPRHVVPKPGSDVAARSARRGARVDSSRPFAASRFAALCSSAGSAELLLSATAKAAPKTAQIRFVQIGAVTVRRFRFAPTCCVARAAADRFRREAFDVAFKLHQLSITSTA